MLLVHPEEKPVVAQLFGHEPDIVAEAGGIVEALGSFCAIDINMGCPAPKIVNNKEGCSLMKDIKTACAIVEKTAARTSLPVTVKFRSGFDPSQKNAVEFARALAESGARALCLHGRLRSQFFAPPVDTETIARVVSSVSIPVIANGDINSPEAAEAMFKQTGCSSLMIGRGALGNPFLFSAIRHNRKTGQTPPPPSPSEKLSVALEHISLMCQSKGEYTALRGARKHMSWYLKGLRGASALRCEINRLTTMEDLKELINKALSLDKEEPIYGS
jgi:nifR3 family TIM-barrel protein